MELALPDDPFVLRFAFEGIIGVEDFLLLLLGDGRLVLLVDPPRKKDRDEPATSFFCRQPLLVKEVAHPIGGRLDDDFRAFVGNRLHEGDERFLGVRPEGHLRCVETLDRRTAPGLGVTRGVNDDRRVVRQVEQVALLRRELRNLNLWYQVLVDAVVDLEQLRRLVFLVRHNGRPLVGPQVHAPIKARCNLGGHALLPGLENDCPNPAGLLKLPRHLFVRDGLGVVED
jgi:hypothetical protein